MECRLGNEEINADSTHLPEPVHYVVLPHDTGLYQYLLRFALASSSLFHFCFHANMVQTIQTSKKD